MLFLALSETGKDIDKGIIHYVIFQAFLTNIKQSISHREYLKNIFDNF